MLIWYFTVFFCAAFLFKAFTYFVNFVGTMYVHICLVNVLVYKLTRWVDLSQHDPGFLSKLVLHCFPLHWWHVAFQVWMEMYWDRVYDVNSHFHFSPPIWENSTREITINLLIKLEREKYGCWLHCLNTWIYSLSLKISLHTKICFPMQVLISFNSKIRILFVNELSMRLIIVILWHLYRSRVFFLSHLNVQRICIENYEIG